MNISLVTMAHGNINALKRTMDSLGVLCNEFIIGDLFLFDSDRKKAYALLENYNAKFIVMPFNFIFIHGFAATLNAIAHYASNDMVIYMNVSEIIDKNLRLDLLEEQYNCYSFNHATDPHEWVRCYNRKELLWNGLIHEVVIGEKRQCPQHLFMMADTEKDMDDPFKAKVMNDVKELVYWRQYLELIENPSRMGHTHKGWRDWAFEQYDSMKQRILNKGKRLEAFEKGDLQMYLDDVMNNPEFEKERFESNKLLNFQGARHDIL